MIGLVDLLRCDVVVAQCIAEFTATFICMFVPVAVFLRTVNSELYLNYNVHHYHFANGITNGLLTGCVMEAFSGFKCGYCNPMIIVGCFIAGELKLTKAVTLVIAEIFGSISGIAVMKAFIHPIILPPPTPESIIRFPSIELKHNEKWADRPEITMYLEGLASFVVVLCAISARDLRRRGVRTPVGIGVGLCYCSMTMCLSRCTGGVLNPAKSVALFFWYPYSDTVQYPFVYGPVFGALLAGLVYNLIFSFDTGRDPVDIMLDQLFQDELHRVEMRRIVKKVYSKLKNENKEQEIKELLGIIPRQGAKPMKDHPKKDTKKVSRKDPKKKVVIEDNRHTPKSKPETKKEIKYSEDPTRVTSEPSAVTTIDSFDDTSQMKPDSETSGISETATVKSETSRQTEKSDMSVISGRSRKSAVAESEKVGIVESDMTGITESEISVTAESEKYGTVENEKAGITERDQLGITETELSGITESEEFQIAESGMLSDMTETEKSGVIEKTEMSEIYGDTEKSDISVTSGIPEKSGLSQKADNKGKTRKSRKSDTSVDKTKTTGSDMSLSRKMSRKSETSVSKVKSSGSEISARKVKSRGSDTSLDKIKSRGSKISVNKKKSRGSETFVDKVKSKRSNTSVDNVKPRRSNKSAARKKSRKSDNSVDKVKSKRSDTSVDKARPRRSDTSVAKRKSRKSDTSVDKEKHEISDASLVKRKSAITEKSETSVKSEKEISDTSDAKEMLEKSGITRKFPKARNSGRSDTSVNKSGEIAIHKDSDTSKRSGGYRDVGESKKTRKPGILRSNKKSNTSLVSGTSGITKKSERKLKTSGISKESDTSVASGMPEKSTVTERYWKSESQTSVVSDKSKRLRTSETSIKSDNSKVSGGKSRGNKSRIYEPLRRSVDSGLSDKIEKFQRSKISDKKSEPPKHSAISVDSEMLEEPGDISMEKIKPERYNDQLEEETRQGLKEYKISKDYEKKEVKRRNIGEPADVEDREDNQLGPSWYTKRKQYNKQDRKEKPELYDTKLHKRYVNEDEWELEDELKNQQEEYKRRSLHERYGDQEDEEDQAEHKRYDADKKYISKKKAVSYEKILDRYEGDEKRDKQEGRGRYKPYKQLKDKEESQVGYDRKNMNNEEKVKKDEFKKYKKHKMEDDNLEVHESIRTSKQYTDQKGKYEEKEKYLYNKNSEPKKQGKEKEKYEKMHKKFKTHEVENDQKDQDRYDKYLRDQPHETYDDQDTRESPVGDESQVKQKWYKIQKEYEKQEKRDGLEMYNRLLKLKKEGKNYEFEKHGLYKLHDKKGFKNCVYDDLDRENPVGDKNQVKQDWYKRQKEYEKQERKDGEKLYERLQRIKKHKKVQDIQEGDDELERYEGHDEREYEEVEQDDANLTGHASRGQEVNGKEIDTELSEDYDDVIES